MNIVYIELNDWFGYDDKRIDSFINLLEYHMPVNKFNGMCINYEIIDLTVFFYITTTEEYLKQHKLDFLLNYTKQYNENYPDINDYNLTINRLEHK